MSTVWFSANRDSIFSRQRGSVLLVSLIMLLLITLVAVGGMQGTILQERMTGNLRDRDLAFQSAEAALREAEQTIDNDPDTEAFTDNQNGFYEVNNDNRPDWQTRANLDNGSGFIEYGGDIPGVAVQPRYFIERLGIEEPPLNASDPIPLPAFFRITALGTGGSENTEVVLTSVYKVR